MTGPRQFCPGRIRGGGGLVERPAFAGRGDHRRGEDRSWGSSLAPHHAAWTDEDPQASLNTFVRWTSTGCIRGASFGRILTSVVQRSPRTGGEHTSGGLRRLHLVEWESSGKQEEKRSDGDQVRPIDRDPVSSSHARSRPATAVGDARGSRWHRPPAGARPAEGRKRLLPGVLRVTGPLAGSIYVRPCPEFPAWVLWSVCQS